ncbi:motility associated factor glycosyltransferase family protein [Acetivibrio clariflavus]|uniref:DUF115 domain-containing protein n=1 Tax=Acetivibrio clariflavus (strain DSM 19732 / NBRC 101661 / EBR45) TaxID=720554 RepID=G8LTL3_ACECE|nr:6-hydroxymethylpterin diphosphokinase MptE-like protein [Acetivibrio clariflavus]AEV70523.1 hypothetical protein Clocl_4089 [Acetivibrio clariflavus DSM 19732]
MLVFEKNIEALKCFYPDIYDEIIKRRRPDTLKYKVESCNNGLYTLKVELELYKEVKRFYLHSRYNPVDEAIKFARQQYRNDIRIHVLYGFALGYHIDEMLKFMQYDDKLYVLENNMDVFYKALELRDLTHIITNSNIELIISQDESNICSKVKSLLNEGVNFIIHPPSLKAIPPENEYFKFVMEDWNIRKSVSKDLLKLIDDNIKINLQNDDPNVGIFFEKFKGQSVIIVSSGPSLDLNIEYLKEAKNKAMIFAVGSSLRPLLLRDIIPDLFVVIDPKEGTLNQIKGFENMEIPMIYLSSAYAGTVSAYKGPKAIACYKKEQLKAEKEKYIVDPGGSVATTALDIAIKMGFDFIILVGQDLAFTNGRNHVQYGTSADVNTKELKNMRKVVGQNGEILYTTLGLLSYKYWIERRIEKENRVFINATEGGALIEGMKHMKLKDVISQYLKRSFNFSQKISTILEESRRDYVQE